MNINEDSHKKCLLIVELVNCIIQKKILFVNVKKDCNMCLKRKEEKSDNGRKIVTKKGNWGKSVFCFFAQQNQVAKKKKVDNGGQSWIMLNNIVTGDKSGKRWKKS